MWYKKLTPLLLFLIVFQSIPISVLAGVSQEISLTNPSVENCGILSFLFGCQQNSQASTSVIGIQGLQGAAGPPGGNNTRWWTGGAPSDLIGGDNDFYLEITGDVYCKTAGAWGAPLFSILGPAGPAGPAGGGGDIGPIYGLIQQNKSAAIRTADDHIATNLTGSGATAAQILELENQFAENDTAHQTVVEGMIASNKTDIFTAVHTNESAVTKWASDAITANLSTVTLGAINQAFNPLFASNKTDTFSGTWTNLSLLINQTAITNAMGGTQANLSLLINNSYSAAALYSADQHISTNLSGGVTYGGVNQNMNPLIASNKTDILTAVHTNESALSLALDTRIGENKSAAIKWASDAVTANLSATGATAAQILAIDTRIGENQSKAVLGAANLITNNLSVISQWILSNQTTVFNNVHANESAMVLADINMDTINRTASDLRIGENKSASILTAANLITNNLSVLSGWIVTNLTVAGNTSAGLALADNHITSNLSAISGWIVTNNTAMMTAQAANRSVAANFSVLAQSIIVPVTNGASLYAPNESLGPIPLVYVGFPRGQWNSSFAVKMPASYTGGTLTYAVDWTADSSAGTVEFDLAGRCSGTDNQIINSYLGANITVIDTMGTKDYIYTSPISGALTMAGTPAASAYCRFNFRRLSGAGTLNSEAKVVAVRVQFPTN